MDIVTLIPAFKPQYLPDLLNSLRLQSRPTRKIIFSDDSPDGAYRATLMSDAFAPLRQGLDIECHEGPRRGGYPNVLRLLDIWAGSSALVHVLLDDDVIYPEFYERHLVAHASAHFSCTISRRWTASNIGQPLAGQPVPPGVAQHGHRVLSLDADVVFKLSGAKGAEVFNFSAGSGLADVVAAVSTVRATDAIFSRTIGIALLFDLGIVVRWCIF